MAAADDTYPAVDEDGTTYMHWYPLNLVRAAYLERRQLDDDESREIAHAARLELERRLGPPLIHYGRIGGGKAAHVLTAVDGDNGRAACGVAGAVTARSEADARAERIDLGPICVTCRERLAFSGDVAIVVVNRPTKRRTTRREGSTTMSKTATAPTDRKKAPSEALLDRDAYASTDADRLKAERLTINNRISGLKTQLKRAAGDADKTKALQARLDDLNSRRTAIAEALAAKPAEQVDEELQNRAALAAGTADAAAELGDGVAAAVAAEGDLAGKTTGTAKPKTTRRRSTAKTSTAKKPAGSTKRK